MFYAYENYTLHTSNIQSMPQTRPSQNRYIFNSREGGREAFPTSSPVSQARSSECTLPLHVLDEMDECRSKNWTELNVTLSR